MVSYVGRGARDPGAWNQPGIIVITPELVAFVATGPRTHLASIAAKAMLAGAGVLVYRVGGRVVEPAGLLAYLRSLSDAELPSVARDLAAQSDGVVFSTSQARYREHRLPLGVRLSFEAPGDRLLVLDAKRVLVDPRYRAAVAPWPTPPPPPPGRPIAAIAAVAVGALLALAAIASSFFTLIVLAAAFSDGTVGGRVTSGFFCGVDALLTIPAVALLTFGIRRLALKGMAS